MLLPLTLAIALAAAPDEGRLDFDAPVSEARSRIESPFLRDMMTAAMALPYKYGVTQMPCKAQLWQPARGWTLAREPSGKIAWVEGPTTRVRWSGIYGTCYIQSRVPRHLVGEVERAALECECNGWLPKGVREFPLP